MYHADYILRKFKEAGDRYGYLHLLSLSNRIYNNSKKGRMEIEEGIQALKDIIEYAEFPSDFHYRNAELEIISKCLEYIVSLSKKDDNLFKFLRLIFSHAYIFTFKINKPLNIIPNELAMLQLADLRSIIIRVIGFYHLL